MRESIHNFIFDVPKTTLLKYRMFSERERERASIFIVENTPHERDCALSVIHLTTK